MYVVNKDELVELDFPQMETGAPMPSLRMDEHEAVLTYDLRDGGTATIRFAVHTVLFGYPNDEALAAHPLRKLGLDSYAAYEIRHSSWVDSMMRANRVHPRHSDDLFTRLRHFILTFHDSTFECVATGFQLTIEANDED